MKKILYFTFIGLICLLFSCQKDETKVVLSDSPIVPTIKTLPNLTLQRTHGKDTLLFVGTPVNPGFNASATYFLEACIAGTNFKDSVVLLSGVQDSVLKITVSDLDGILLKKFPADQVSSVDFRIRSVLSVDAGTGAPGTGNKLFVYTSASKTANVTIYGVPRLDLIGSGLTQKIESALGDGNYFGFVKLDATKAFTVNDPDANIVYGDKNGALSVNGAGISVATNGWYKLNVDTKGLTYKLAPYKVGLIGDATPNGWNAPDTKMDYDSKTGSWYITVALVDGTFKFRCNDDWNSGINLGLGTGYSLDNLYNSGSSSNIPITAGNYTIRLYILSSSYKCTITKNN